MRRNIWRSTFMRLRCGSYRASKAELRPERQARRSTQRFRTCIEAMANGTPVIAFGRGSVPEIIDHGITGFIVDSVDEAVAAIPLAEAIDRGTIRRRFEERFSVERMARDYLALYGEVLRRGTVGAVLSSAATAHATANAA